MKVERHDAGGLNSDVNGPRLIEAIALESVKIVGVEVELDMVDPRKILMQFVKDDCRYLCLKLRELVGQGWWEALPFLVPRKTPLSSGHLSPGRVSHAHRM